MKAGRPGLRYGDFSLRFRSVPYSYFCLFAHERINAISSNKSTVVLICPKVISVKSHLIFRRHVSSAATDVTRRRLRCADPRGESQLRLGFAAPHEVIFFPQRKKGQIILLHRPWEQNVFLLLFLLQIWSTAFNSFNLSSSFLDQR